MHGMKGEGDDKTLHGAAHDMGKHTVTPSA